MFNRRDGTREQGQVLVLLAMMMVVMLGMAATVIDLGGWYLAKRQLLAATDAAALAGASQLPNGWLSAQSAAAEYFAKNAKTGDHASYTATTNLTANDTVKVTASRAAPIEFARLFGIDDVTITVASSATVKSYTTIVSTGQVMPWAIMKNSFTLGNQYSIYTDNSSPSNGSLSLPVKDSAGGCGAAAGGDDYRHAIDGSSPLCDLSVNQVVDVKTGQNTGPTKQGIDTRVTSWQPITSIVQFTSGGNAIVLQPNSPQLVILPIVENLSGGSQWPGGAGQVRIRGFGYFVLNQPGYSDGGKTVLGTFVGLQNTDTHWITGAYDPANNTAHTVQLTG